MYIYSRRDKREREKKKDISSCLIVVNKRRVIYLNFLRTSHISNWCDLHTFYSSYPARTSGTTRMGWKNVEKLDGLRQSCHRQWHSRGGFFRERTIDTWRKWLNGWRMENLSLPVTYGQFLQRYLDNVCYFISEFFPYFSFKCNKERIITSCLSYIISFGLQQLNVF